jgi:hypothetical protein
MYIYEYIAITGILELGSDIPSTTDEMVVPT